HARVAERHTGTGLKAQTIIERGLPLPVMDWEPVTLEEKLVCYADKFYSKSRIGEEKTHEQVLRSLAKFGTSGVEIFKQWTELFE
ncbi:MAG: phosphohydrolase, partial [Bacteroidaceae bacterium]|nr:phosphohydrolase [Bacteroidaceae bacterium]